MKKLLLALVATLALTGSMVVLSTTSASADPGSPSCMTLREWRKIDDGMTRAQVDRIVGNQGKKGRTTHFSDGTMSYSVDYRQCRANGKPAASWYTASIYFETEVKYGDYVWDEYANWVDGYEVGNTYVPGHWEGDYVWDEWAENGVTRTPVVSYKGAF